MAKSSKKENSFLRVAVAVPLHRLFDYSPPDGVDTATLSVGVRVKVPFGRREKVGVLVAITGQSELHAEYIKPALAILDSEPLLAESDLQLLQWISSYYHHPLGEVMSQVLPVLLRRGKPARVQVATAYVLTESGLTVDPETLTRAHKQRQLLQKLKALAQPATSEWLNSELNQWRPVIKALIDKGWVKRIEQQHRQPVPPPESSPALQANAEQQQAIAAVTETFNRFAVHLLEGVTGSGKTEVYMQLIEQVIAQDRQVLVLLPEISLTPQLERRFKQRFSVAVEVSHSGLSDLQRSNIWLKSHQALVPIVLGTRSVLLTPMPRLGLIIIDEEHDSSFKQQEGLRFSARDVAVVRAKQLHIPVLLGTATPSLESFYNAQSGRYRWLHLSSRAGSASEPKLTLLDIRNKRIHDGLSETLIQEINRVVANGEQVLLFLNRRGFAPALMCHGCGWVARCQRCDANLVVHFQQQQLRCHHCGHQQRLLQQCPDCRGAELVSLGLGTERVEAVLKQFFPHQTVVRLDRDTTRRKGELEQHLQRINQGDADIILGTQMLAKGHHFPEVTLVGILDVDSGLFSIDFHATEKMAQMIVQVSGRAGRSEKPGRVIMQTRQPEHPLLQTLIGQGYRQFAAQTLLERQQANLPPYSYQALYRVLAVDKQLALDFLEQLASIAGAQAGDEVEILGPVSAPMARRAGRYRYQLLIQARHRAGLHQLLNYLTEAIVNIKAGRKVRWSLDVDPVDLY